MKLGSPAWLAKRRRPCAHPNATLHRWVAPDVDALRVVLACNGCGINDRYLLTHETLVASGVRWVGRFQAP